jgi:hypothetical protein
VNAIDRARYLLGLTQPPRVHLAGTALVLGAMWRWRVAPAQLPKGGIGQAKIAEALWHHEGPSVVPELLAHVYHHLYEEYLGGKVLQLLAMIGRPAQPPVRASAVSRRSTW